MGIITKSARGAARFTVKLKNGILIKIQKINAARNAAEYRRGDK